MIVLADGRYQLNQKEIAGKIWEKIKGWVVEDINNPTHIIPAFPICDKRKLIPICQPCGKVSALNYHCSLKESFVSVAYCIGCVERGENEPKEPIAET